MQYGTNPYEIGSKTARGVKPKDIAHSLARIVRFTGHSKHPISVARHSTYVSKLLDMDPLVSLYGHVHELPETVTNDISHPFKEALFGGLLGWFARRRFKKLEGAAEAALFEVMGIPYPMPPEIKALVKRADNAAVLAEKRDLCFECSRDWDMVPGFASHVKATPSRNPAEDAAEWLARYHELAKHLNITPKVWE